MLSKTVKITGITAFFLIMVKLDSSGVVGVDLGGTLISRIGGKVDVGLHLLA